MVPGQFARTGGRILDPVDTGTDNLTKQLEEFQQFQNFRATKEVGVIINRCRQPFTLDILQYWVPKDVKIPKIEPYMGNMSSSEHLDKHITWMNLNKESDALLYMLFSMNLGGHARVWFHSLPTGSIPSFQDLSDRFVTQFAGAKLVRKPMDLLKSIRQCRT